MADIDPARAGMTVAVRTVFLQQDGAAALQATASKVEQETAIFRRGNSATAATSLQRPRNQPSK